MKEHTLPPTPLSKNCKKEYSSLTHSLFRDEFDQKESDDSQHGHPGIEQVVIEHSLLLGPCKLVHGERRSQRLKHSKHKENDEEEEDADGSCDAIIRPW